MSELKTFLLSQREAAIKAVMVGLPSDIIGIVVKLMDNAELTKIGQTVFNPLPGSKVGAKGYMGARVQPNLPGLARYRPSIALFETAFDHLVDLQWTFDDKKCNANCHETAAGALQY